MTLTPGHVTNRSHSSHVPAKATFTRVYSPGAAALCLASDDSLVVGTSATWKARVGGTRQGAAAEALAWPNQRALTTEEGKNKSFARFSGERRGARHGQKEGAPVEER